MVPKPRMSCQLTVSDNSLDCIYVLYVYPYPTHVSLDIRVPGCRIAVRCGSATESKLTKSGAKVKDKTPAEHLYSQEKNH